MNQVIFICKTCEYRNRMETGVEGYEQKQTRFESLTEAWQHIYSTAKSQYESIHEMTTEIVES